MAAGGIAGATGVQTPRPTTFAVSRLQAEEIGAVVGFLRAYNARHLKAALSHFEFPKKLGYYERDGATDCDYRRRETRAYEHRAGVVRWLRQRFADHDRLTLGRILDENPGQLVGVVGVEFTRRTSDTLRRLGYTNGIVPQATMKLPIHFVHGVPRFPFFALASRSAPTPNPECNLVRPRK